jgi:hypothetical protein
MKATLLLRAEHRNIEQALAILSALCDLHARDFEALAAAMLAHLDVEEHVIYPLWRTAAACDGAADLAEHASLRAAIVEAQDASDRATLRRQIAELAVAFSAHVLRQDGAVYSCLEEVSSRRRLEELALAVASYRHAAIPAYRFAVNGRSAAE